jgi:AcrR family transcriptional regulator
MTVAAPPREKPVRRTQAQRAQQTQQKLVDSAIGLLRQKRYVGFRTAEAAAAAGVSRGAQTHHFPMKDALVLQALEQVYRDTQARALQRIARAKGDPQRLVAALLEDSEEFFLGADFLLSLDLLMVGAEQPLGVEVKRLAKTYRLSVEQAWLAALLESGYPREHTQDVVLLTFSIARGLGIRKLMSGDTAGFARLMDLWQHLVSEMLGDLPQSPARPARNAARSKAHGQ